MVKMTVELRDISTGTFVNGEYLLDPASGSATLQTNVWNALVALYGRLQTQITAAQSTLPPTLT
jgi:hypothetical protein